METKLSFSEKFLLTLERRLKKQRREIINEADIQGVNFIADRRTRKKLSRNNQLLQKVQDVIWRE